MLDAFRGSRLLALFLLAASPAGVGTLAPALHPCPVDLPWLAQKGATDEHAGHHASSDRPAHESHSCTCIGSWQSGSAVVPPVPHELAQPFLVSFSDVILPAVDSSLELSPRSTLLPPATAPPLL